MPFINVKTNVPVGSDKEKAIKSALGRDITALPGKTENWLMVGEMIFGACSSPSSSGTSITSILLSGSGVGGIIGTGFPGSLSFPAVVFSDCFWLLFLNTHSSSAILRNVTRACSSSISIAIYIPGIDILTFMLVSPSHWHAFVMYVQLRPPLGLYVHMIPADLPAALTAGIDLRLWLFLFLYLLGHLISPLHTPPVPGPPTHP